MDRTMSETTDRAPMGKMLAVFVGTAIAANTAVIGIAYLFPDLTMPDSLGIIFTVLAAMAAGQVAGQISKRRLTMREKATFAVAATVLSFLLIVGALWAVFSYIGLPLTLQNAVLGLTGRMVSPVEIADMLPLVAVIMTGVSLLVCFLAVGWGARAQVKTMERQAAKAG
jgi:predicted neutral ceramidase superfamily lipid hydrolase